MALETGWKTLGMGTSRGHEATHVSFRLDTSLRTLESRISPWRLSNCGSSKIVKGVERGMLDVKELEVKETKAIY